MPKRDRLLRIVNDPSTSDEERREAQRELDAENFDFSRVHIVALLADDGCIGFDDSTIRALYLCGNDTASIEWGQLAFWRDRLNSKHQALRLFSERCIEMFASYGKIPTDVRQAAANFLVQYKVCKAGDPLPELQIPGNKPAGALTPEELYYGFMVPIQKVLTEILTPR